MVSICGSASDSTSTLFVNNVGQAIINDSSTLQDYLYSGGLLIPIASLLPPDLAYLADSVTGLTNSGNILLGDPFTLTLLDPSALGLVDGAQDVRLTDAYQAVSASQGGATPDASFFATPSLPSSGGSAVPAPTSLGLLALGLFATLGRKRKQTV
jgi:hypothetical protein